MKNVLDFQDEVFPENIDVLCFDIKGSTAGRKSLEDPKSLVEMPIGQLDIKDTLKDQDFMLSFGKLNISGEQSKKVLNQLEKDAKFFSKFLLIDYSLLLFIINIPYRCYVSIRKGEVKKQSRDIGVGNKFLELFLAEQPINSVNSLLTFEERDREINAIYKVNNQKDVELIKHLDNQFTGSKIIGKSHKPNKETPYKENKIKSVDTTLQYSVNVYENQ
jgi:hypothetical protein